MVFYFTCSDSRYTIYMGRDKYENEELIRYGWPEDLWFHVDKLSSAHVYLRLPPGDDFSEVPMAIVHECAQLTKLNSIEGCKQTSVPIVYTPWINLRKTGDMATGQVGFHNRAAVRHVTVEHRSNEICNRLNKTKVEQHSHPAELAELREARDAGMLAEARAGQKEQRKGEALQRESDRQARKTRDEEQVRSAQELAAEAERLQENLLARFAAAAVQDSAATVSAPSGFDSGGDGGGFRDALDDVLDELEEGGGGDGYVGEGLSVKELEKRQAREAAASKAREMDNLTALAHARRAEAEKETAEKAARKATAQLERARVAKEEEVSRLAAEEAARSELPARRAADAARVAACVAAARAALEAEGGLSRAALEENRGLQDDERTVLLSMFGEDECTIEEHADGMPGGGDLLKEAPAVRLTVVGTDKAGAERRLVLRASPPTEYPSHLPPACEVLEGLDGPAAAAERAHVCDLLALRFFDEHVGSFVTPQWVEWLRDEWMSQQRAAAPS